MEYVFVAFVGFFGLWNDLEYQGHYSSCQVALDHAIETHGELMEEFRCHRQEDTTLDDGIPKLIIK